MEETVLFPDRAIFYALIGSLLQWSRSFISWPVNDAPVSISVILHSSLAIPPFIRLPVLSSQSTYVQFFFFIQPSSYEDPSAESFSRHLSVIHPVTCFFPLGYHAGILFFQKTLCRKYSSSSFLAHHRSKSSQKMLESSGEERGLYKIWWGIEMRRRCENGWECDTAKIQRPGLARKM